MGGKSTLSLIKADIDRYSSNPDYASRPFPKGNSVLAYFLRWLYFMIRGGCFRVIFLYRLGKLGKFLKIIIRPPYGSTTIIDCPNVVGGGIYFSHAWGTILNCEHIGYGCAFLHNTTFGNIRLKDGRLVRPYLENNVHVGANVIVIGDVHIGNNVKIGAGAVVTKNIPDNCTVVGNPARIIVKDGVRVNIPL